LISPILCFKEVISDFLKKWLNLKNVKISKKFYYFLSDLKVIKSN
jgi:hypothetical protein